MKKLILAMCLVSSTLPLVLCLTSSAKAQGSQMSSSPSASSRKSHETVAIKVKADLATNMCLDGQYVIIDHPFTNNRKDVVFGAVYTWTEDETAVGQSVALTGFAYYFTPNGDCPVKKWLMHSVQSGDTYVFTATRKR